tara:strand:- start:4414 stop:4911 length:498 start_codon:yes stop_codon:yes gene_type:complete
MTTGLIIALSTTVIAVCALGVSFWQGYLQSRHQKLSVQPHMTIDFETRSNNDVAVYFRSNGLGPAKLIEYSWLFNNKIFSIESHRDYGDLLNALGLGDESAELYSPHMGGYVEQGFSTFFVRFLGSAGSEQHKEVSSRLCQAKIMLRYESIYGEEFSEVYDAKFG